MDIVTHLKIDPRLCGSPMTVAENHSRVEMATLPEMAADEKGLVHGGFVFGLADYAAMIAVNHPNVVLGKADVLFLRPVRVGETIAAVAHASPREDKKQVVTVAVYREEIPVFKGEFTCFVLENHVMDV